MDYNSCPTLIAMAWPPHFFNAIGAILIAVIVKKYFYTLVLHYRNNKRTECIIELDKLEGIFNNTRELSREAQGTD